MPFRIGGLLRLSGDLFRTGNFAKKVVKAMRAKASLAALHNNMQRRPSKIDNESRPAAATLCAQGQ